MALPAIPGWVAAAVTAIGVLVLRIMGVDILTQLLKPIGTVFSFCIALYARVMVPVALWMFKKIASIYFVETKMWAPFLADYMTRLTGIRMNADDLIDEFGGLRGIKAMENLGARFMKPILGMIMPTPKEVREDPLMGVETFLGTNLTFQMQAWLLHFIGDAVSLGRFKSLKDLPNAIAWSFGIGWLSWMALGPVFRAGIAAWAERYFNEIYGPELLTPTQAFDAVTKGKWSIDRFMKEMYWRGYDPERATLLYQSMVKDYPDAVIGWMLKWRVIDREEAMDLYRQKGYDEGQAKAMMMRHVLEKVEKYEEERLERLIDLAVDRVFPIEALKPYLDNRLAPETEYMLIEAIVRARQGRRRFLTPAQVTKLWRLNKMGRYECRDYLLMLGFTKEDADLYMDLRAEEVK